MTLGATSRPAAPASSSRRVKLLKSSGCARGNVRLFMGTILRWPRSIGHSWLIEFERHITELAIPLDLQHDGAVLVPAGKGVEVRAQLLDAAHRNAVDRVNHVADRQRDVRREHSL